MNINNWKIFNKKGNNLNLFPDPYLSINFKTDVEIARGAEAFFLTGPNGLISETIVKNGGFGYDPGTQVYLDYAFDNQEPYLLEDASIIFGDVSVFDPEPSNKTTIVDVDISNEPLIDGSVFIYPSVTYSSAIFMEPVSEKLVETEHLVLLEYDASTDEYIRPYDPVNSKIIFRVENGDEEIKLFTVDEEKQEIIWTEELEFDISEYVVDQPIVLNIGFRAEDEGIFERRLRCYHIINNKEHLLWEVIVNSEAIGQDERFQVLQQNFGLPEPKSISKLFKEVDINEVLPDWKILNYKGKHMILDHANIMPFIGTYKGLINAIKWLGYEDIKVKEWFKNVKNREKLSLYIPYEAEGRKKTILTFSARERRHLKKLNELSLVYCLTRETGEIDKWGTPETENCYEYTLDEILIKLFALKDWLERYIIGVNARIISIDGEGIYFETFRNSIYSTTNTGTEGKFIQSLSPTTLQESSELVQGDASINLTLKEYDQITFKDYISSLRIKDFGDYGWDPSNNYFSISEINNLDYIDPSAVYIGSPFYAALPDLNSIRWVLNLEKPYSGVLTEEYVTNSLFILDNTIRFYDSLDTSTYFHDSSINLYITLDKAYLRDPSISNVWLDSLAYSIYPDPSISGKWILESSTGDEYYSQGKLRLFPHLPEDGSALLQYAYDDNYNIPLFTIKDFRWIDASGITRDFDEDNLYLEIENGRIAMSSYINEEHPEDSSITFNREIRKFIDFYYDEDLNEQQINLNVSYDSGRMPVYSYDASIYYDAVNTSASPYFEQEASALVIDNSIHMITVNHIGDYDIFVYGYDGANNSFMNSTRQSYNVWVKHPTIWAYIDTSINNDNESITEDNLTILDVSTLPLFDRRYILRNITLEYDANGEPFIKVPSISYFISTPEDESVAHFYNLTERVTDVSAGSSTLYYLSAFQDFKNGDDINIVKFDKGDYYIIDEASTHIISATDTELVVDNIPIGFETIDASSQMYILNDTYRDVSIIDNSIGEKIFVCDISTYTFLENQLVGIIIEDTSTNYSWGSSMRVIDSSGTYHELNGNIPQFIANDPSRYEITAKHSFSTFSTTQIDISTAFEDSQNFHIYLDDIYYQQYYLDSTFIFSNIMFDEERVLEDWMNTLNSDTSIYGYDFPVILDSSAFVLLRSLYDHENYMLNQKNIWSITRKDLEYNEELVMKVFNKEVPFIYREEGEYNILVESYDKYGNLQTQEYEALIKINED